MTFSILTITSICLAQGNLSFFSSGQNFHFLFMFLKQLKIVEYRGWKGSERPLCPDC